MPKDNLLFRLDNLEYQFHYLNGTLEQFQPRLNSTTKIFNAKSKKTSKKINNLLENASLSDTLERLNKLQLEIFDKKVYHLDNHLRTFLHKQITQYRPTKKTKFDFTKIISEIETSYGVEEFVELISKSKVVKLSLVKICPSKKNTPPNWFLNHPFWKIHEDKTQNFNPSRVWNEVVLKLDGAEKLISTLMNNEKCKDLFSKFNSGMDVFLAINRDKKDKSSNHSPGSNAEAMKNRNESESEEDNSSQGESDLEAEGDGEFNEETLEQFDQLIAASDDDEEKNDKEFVLDPDTNYNEVTDEEPDGELSEDDVEMPSRKKQKIKLPELMGGYYSGGESVDESDPAEDRVAREQISLKDKKKNRRGQRARRKIWEKKYGRGAKHIQEQVRKDMEDRKKKQDEYEIRVAKRAAKAAERETEDANSNKEDKKIREPQLQPDHPSWVAKKQAEEKQKNVKFEGKKIKFD